MTRSRRVRFGVDVGLVVASLFVCLSGCDPVHVTAHDPVGVRVSADGTLVEIAVDPCTSFRITEVKLTAAATETPDAATDIWDFRVRDPSQRLFSTSAQGPAVVTKLIPLTRLPNDVFQVLVHYDPASAPKAFRDRGALQRVVFLKQSSSDVRRYESLATKRCTTS